MKAKNFIVGVLLGIFLLLNWASALEESLTYDERAHFKTALAEWQERNFSLDPHGPPLIRLITVLPILIQSSGTESFLPLHRQVLPARMMISLFGLILALVIYRYTDVSFGSTAAFFALILFVFEPNILAHSHYLTLDIGATLAYFLAYVFILDFLRLASFGNALKTGVFLGLALASKVTIIVPFILSLLWVIYLNRKKLNRNFWQKAFISLVLAGLVIWATYSFALAPIIAEREDPQRLSEKILRYSEEKNLTFLKHLIDFGKYQSLPLGNYLATIKNCLVFNLKPNRVEFLGKLYPGNRWYFLLVIFFLKTPIPLLFLFFCGLLVIGKNKKFLPLLIPILLMFFFFSFSQSSGRLRYLLPIWPFLIIIAARGADWFRQRKSGKILLVLSFLVYLGGTLFYYPHFITFANGPFIFADSNGDWGQGLISLVEYIKKENVVDFHFSYFGTDSPENYGLVADKPFGEKFEERCPLYSIKTANQGEKIIAISLTNYYYCGYWQQEEFGKEKIKDVIGRSILVFK